VADTQPPEIRSRIMSSVPTKDTGLELALRQALTNRGLLFSVHDRSLPGTPDIVFPEAKVAVQARGCFWHSHGCRKSRPPSSRTEYWLPKLAANRRRDARDDRRLRRMGWSVLAVWECSAQEPSALERQTSRIVRLIRTRQPISGVDPALHKKRTENGISYTKPVRRVNDRRSVKAR
jgi:DNA mismatch endonuclease (patch repair protein)